MSLWSRFLAHPVLSLGLMYVKKFNSYCQVLKKMHAKKLVPFFCLTVYYRGNNASC